MTPDQLYDFIRKSPANAKANETAVSRAGKSLLVYSAVDIEALAKKINEHFRKVK